MKKTLLLALILLLCISLSGCKIGKTGTQTEKEGQQQEQSQETSETDQREAVNTVLAFGQKLQMVSLLAPEDVVIKSIEENYGAFVAPALLAKWQKDPQKAPGRITSSPWPDRIEIQTEKKLSKDSYQVKGEIIEITSTEQVNGGIVAKRPITLLVKKIDSRWLIDDVTLGAYQEAGSVVYENTEYGFNFYLPESWKGYQIVAGKWEGLAVEDAESSKVVETGPEIFIRHPQWTAEKPRQDIPIMIFTLAQWKSLEQDRFHIGAAPVGPKELSRSTQYVMALPARYNYAFPEGYEEVENILQSNPLHTDENK